MLTSMTNFGMQANSVDPDQTAPSLLRQTAPRGAVWSRSSLFAQRRFRRISRRHKTDVTSRRRVKYRSPWGVLLSSSQLWYVCLTSTEMENKMVDPFTVVCSKDKDKETLFNVASLNLDITISINRSVSKIDENRWKQKIWTIMFPGYKWPPFFFF